MAGALSWWEGEQKVDTDNTQVRVYTDILRDAVDDLDGVAVATGPIHLSAGVVGAVDTVLPNINLSVPVRPPPLDFSGIVSAEIGFAPVPTAPRHRRTDSVVPVSTRPRHGRQPNREVQPAAAEVVQPAAQEIVQLCTRIVSLEQSIARLEAELDQRSGILLAFCLSVFGWYLSAWSVTALSDN